jgi:hypothetical protein
VAASKSKKLDGQVATSVIHPEPLPGDGEGLAGGSSHENINWPCIGADRREVAKVRHPREAMGEDGRRGRLDLGDERAPPAERLQATDAASIPEQTEPNVIAHALSAHLGYRRPASPAPGPTHRDD